MWGVELENQGGDRSAGSHWEARYMLGDYIISTDYIEYSISDITLAYFEDIEFYKVNYYNGGLLPYNPSKSKKIDSFFLIVSFIFNLFK